MSRRLAHLAALACAAALAGCGGGNGDDGDRLSEAEYQAQGNAVCVDYERRVRAIRLEGDSPEAVTAYVDKVLPLGREQVRKLEELQPPEELQNRHNALVLAALDVVGAVESLRAAAEKGDRAAAAGAQQRGEVASARADQIARDLGLESCVDGAGSGLD